MKAGPRDAPSFAVLVAYLSVMVWLPLRDAFDEGRSEDAGCHFADFLRVGNGKDAVVKCLAFGFCQDGGVRTEGSGRKGEDGVEDGSEAWRQITMRKWVVKRQTSDIFAT